MPLVAPASLLWPMLAARPSFVSILAKLRQQPQKVPEMMMWPSDLEKNDRIADLGIELDGFADRFA